MFKEAGWEGRGSLSPPHSAFVITLARCLKHFALCSKIYYAGIFHDIDLDFE